jgi:hypothetical protein
MPPAIVAVAVPIAARATVVLMHNARAEGEGAEQYYWQGAEKEFLKHE